MEQEQFFASLDRLVEESAVENGGKNKQAPVIHHETGSVLGSHTPISMPEMPSASERGHDLLWNGTKTPAQQRETADIVGHFIRALKDVFQSRR